MLRNKGNNKYPTKLQIIVKLYKDGCIDDFILLNLLGLYNRHYKKAYLIELDEVFRKYPVRTVKDSETGSE